MKKRFFSVLYFSILFIFSCGKSEKNNYVKKSIHANRAKKVSTYNSELAKIPHKVGEVRPNVPYLSVIEQKRRKEIVSDVSYDIYINVQEQLENDIYLGETKISFLYQKNVSELPLTIDFTNGSVKEVSVNNRVVQTVYNGNFISLENSDLIDGKNEVAIKYSHKYDMNKNGSVEPTLLDHDQKGFHKILDSADGKTYLYTQLEVYHANELFPCFDQVDLKATYSLSVDAPVDWKVISASSPENVSIKTRTKTKERYKAWKFKKTKEVFSTYLFSLHAGPFYVWEREEGVDENRIPLKIYSRQSVSKKLNYYVEEWFDVTIAGFKYFENLFKIDYPFEKYDQVVVNEYAAGAMENVGAVTFSEDVAIFDHSVFGGFAEKMTYLAEVTFHEMAHMWFGDLVTPNEWNNLWLNESFASYYERRGVFEGLTNPEDISQMNLEPFYDREMRKSSNESWGIAYLMGVGLFGDYDYFYHKGNFVDSYQGGHPIMSTHVKNTEEANGIFDAVTYTKGGAVLAQLSSVMGVDNFDKTIRSYLSKNSYENASSETLFLEFEEGFEDKKNFKSWANEWLKTAGINNALVNIRCDENQEFLESYEIEQGYGRGTSKVLRTHKTSIAHYFENENYVLENKPFISELVYSGRKTVLYNEQEDKLENFPTIRSGKNIGKFRCPKTVIPDFFDYDYAFYEIDSNSYDVLGDFYDLEDRYLEVRSRKERKVLNPMN